jgi:Aspartyl/Asparaginyl beta-hydroxylase
MQESSLSLSAQADRAASAGDMAEARRLLKAAHDAGEGDVDLLLKLAAICRAEADIPAALDAVAEALKLDPLHFVALLLNASLLERAQSPEADEHYGRALAQRPKGPLPPQLTAMVDHAEARYRAFQARTDGLLAQAIAGTVAKMSADETARLARFRTNTARVTAAYHSQPTDYHFPHLAEFEFFDRSRFAWLERLEAATDTIAADFERVAAAERAELVPYVQYPEGVPLRQWEALNHSRDWLAIHLWRNGEIVDENARHCSATMALLETLPQPDIAGVSPNAMFSLLAPGAHIPPHHGIANTRVVCHLPLLVPDGCWFRVGAQRRDWRPGEAWIFDDTIEHEAANESRGLRVIFICDIWHPDLSDPERAGVRALVEAHTQRADGGL